MSDASESPPVEEKKEEKPVETGEEPKPQEGEEQKPATPSIETKAYEWLSAGTSWGTSWLATAKEKTLSTMELVKKDLSEFSDVMAHEAQAIASATKENVQKQAQFVQQLVSPEEEQAPTVGEAEAPAESSTKKPVGKSDSGFGWMKGFVDTIKSLAVEETTKGEEDITETIRPRVHRSTTLSTVRLHEIATSEATFLDAPEGDDAAAFEEFAKKFRVEEYDAEMSSLLATNPPMRLVYSNLVPSQVDNFTFWTRYFFKVEQAELNEQLKNSLTRELVVDVNPTADEGKKAAVKEDGAKRERKGSEASPSSDDSLSVVSSSTNTQNASPQTDETWSICSKEDEATHEDADEKEDKDKGLLTPKAEDKGEWVDWDE